MGKKKIANEKTLKVGDEVTVFIFNGKDHSEKICTIDFVNNENNVDVITEEGEKIENVVRKENLGAYAKTSTHFIN